MFERKQKIRSLLETAFAKGELLRSGSFIYQIEKNTVCENGFVVMLGFSSNDKPRMWREVKQRIQKGIFESSTELAENVRCQGQRLHARNFIIAFIARECDKLPNKTVSIVPYVYVKTFWADYDYTYRSLLNTGQVGCGQIASYQTFKRAFKELKGMNIRILIAHIRYLYDSILHLN
jgi:hypothetical protein